MKVQRVDMFVCPSASPADTSGLQALADAGKIKPGTLVALVGKTDGTGFHDDWGRIWADAALREWTAKFLGVPKDDVAKHVIRNAPDEIGDPVEGGWVHFRCGQLSR